MVQPFHDLGITVYHTIHPKLREDLLIDLFICQFHRCLYGRIIDVIVQKRCRYDLLVRMLSALQFHCRIHIDHQL